MNSPAIEATNKGMDLVRRMHFAKERMQRADSERSSATCELNNAESALVNWLVPSDAKIGDVYYLPVAEAFLEVRVTQSSAVAAESSERPIIKAYRVGWRGNRPPKDPIR